MRTTNKAPSHTRPEPPVPMDLRTPKQVPSQLRTHSEPLERPEQIAGAGAGGAAAEVGAGAGATEDRSDPSATTAPSGTDYSSFGSEALDRAADQLHGIHNATLAELFSIGIAKERQSTLDSDGARDLASWFSLRFGLSHRTGVKWAEAAHGLSRLPQLRAAFSSGEVSLDKVVAAVRFATPETDELVASKIRDMHATQVELTARRSKVPSEADEKDARRKRRVSWRWSDGGTMLNLYARLTAEQGAKVTAALERAGMQMPRRDDEDELSLSQRMADALAALAAVKISSDADPDRANVLIHVDLETLRTGMGAAWNEDGAMFGSSTIGRLLCDARLQALVEDADGKPLGLGHSTRAIPVWMRRAVKTRDKCCRFPGCGRTDFLVPHHIREWVRHKGPSDPDNLVTLCPFHHALVHKSQWSVDGTPSGDLVFIGPKGPVRDGPPPLDYDVKKWLWEDLYRPSTEALFDSS